MNQTQRKHIQTRLADIYSRKRDAVRAAFTANPDNKFKTRPYPMYPSQVQLVLKLAGFESPAILKYTGEELKEAILNDPRLSVNNFADPINKALIDEADTHNAVISDRNRVEVDTKLAVYKSHHDRCLDTLVLSNDLEYITSAITTFENFEV